MKFKRKLGNLRRAVFGIMADTLDRVPATSLSAITIGNSIKGNKIPAYKLGSGKKNILIVAGIHGNETGTVKLALNLLGWLESGGARYKELTFLIIPCLNPDGYTEALLHPDYLRGGTIGRFNANGVDINRNFPTPTFQSRAHWARGKNYEEHVEVYSGEKPNSEPETQALLNLIKKEKVEFIIAFHNAGSDVIGNKVKPSEEAAKLFSETSGFRFENNDEWMKAKRTGTLKEWSEINNIGFLEIEGSSRWGSDWRRQSGALKKVIDFLAASD